MVDNWFTASPDPSQTDYTLGPGGAAHLWCMGVIGEHRISQLSPHTLGRSDMSAFNSYSVGCNKSANSPINWILQHLGGFAGLLTHSTKSN